MKKITIFESSIIGLLVGVVVSTYITFLASTGSFVGYILSWVSLRPFLGLLVLPPDLELLGSFIFYILVYVVYGMIVGLLLGKVEKTRRIITAVALLVIVFGSFEQFTYPQVKSIEDYSVATPYRSTNKQEKQYFGKEAVGDLNGDSLPDIAFLIPRIDGNKAFYYLTSALQTESGKTGTNLIFLGSAVTPENISIDNGTILISYTNELGESQLIRAQVTDGILNFIEENTSSI